LIEKFHTQAEKFGAEFIFGKVTLINKLKQGFEVVVDEKDKYRAKTLILTVGKVPRKLGVPGEDKFLGKGVSTCATCDGPLFKDKVVAVVGGGNSALEAVMDLASHVKKVYLIHRRDEFRADEVTIEKVKRNPKVEMLLNSAPVEVKGEKFMTGIMVEDVNSKTKKELKLDGMFLEIGYVVDATIFKNLVNINDKNEIIADSVGRTSCEGIFAAGDVTNTPYKQAIIAAGDGARAALQAYAYIVCGETNVNSETKEAYCTKESWGKK
jgi:thioredoxin reductase